MAGHQSRALIIVSKARGWDPTQIYDYSSKRYVGSIVDWDVQPEVFAPDLAKAPAPNLLGSDTDPPVSPGIDWQTPQPDGNTPRRTRASRPAIESADPPDPMDNRDWTGPRPDGNTPRRSGGDPYSGMGGM